MSETRRAGWWLPEPVARFDAPKSPERTARFRLFGAWAVRLWALIVAAFTGLLWSNHASFGQTFFGGVLFAGGTGMVVLVVMVLAWCSS